MSAIRCRRQCVESRPRLRLLYKAHSNISSAGKCGGTFPSCLRAQCPSASPELIALISLFGVRWPKKYELLQMLPCTLPRKRVYTNAVTNRISFVSDCCACPAGRWYQHRINHKVHGIMLFSNTLPFYLNRPRPGPRGFARLASTSDGASNVSHHVISHGCCVMPPWSVALRK